MLVPSSADPVKLIAAVLWSDRSALEEALRRLEVLWGRIDHLGSDHPFDASDYYEPEMGPNLEKRVISFEPLVASERLADFKRESMSIEEFLQRPTGRCVNLDPGYLDVHKVVLASVKPACQKIHVGRGVYADMVLRYSRGSFHPFEWTFTDYRQGVFDASLMEIRSLYKVQLARASSTGSCGSSRKV